MEVRSLSIPEVKLITPKKFGDSRGFFSEVYNKNALLNQKLDAQFVQDNHSLSTQRWIVRGLHFQVAPHAQDKLIRVTRGAIFDVAVDIRCGSPTYGKHVSVTLTADNWHQLWVPQGFAHGFCALEPETEVVYKVTDYYSPECDFGLAWDDEALDIPWPVEKSVAILSDKDRGHPTLANLPAYFEYAT